MSKNKNTHPSQLSLDFNNKSNKLQRSSDNKWSLTSNIKIVPLNPRKEIYERILRRLS